MPYDHRPVHHFQGLCVHKIQRRSSRFFLKLNEFTSAAGPVVIHKLTKIRLENLKRHRTIESLVVSIQRKWIRQMFWVCLKKKRDSPLMPLIIITNCFSFLNLQSLWVAHVQQLHHFHRLQIMYHHRWMQTNHQSLLEIVKICSCQLAVRPHSSHRYKMFLYIFIYHLCHLYTKTGIDLMFSLCVATVQQYDAKSDFIQLKFITSHTTRVTSSTNSDTNASHAIPGKSTINLIYSRNIV